MKNSGEGRWKETRSSCCFVALAAEKWFSVTPHDGSGIWSVNANNTYYNTGNVGIGTITPSTYGHGGTAKILEVNNSGTAANSQAHLMLYSGVNSLADSAIGTITWAQPGGMAAYIGAQTRSTTPNAPAAMLTFGTRKIGDGAASPKMVITEEGNVGIGTTAPAVGYRLEVSGATRLTPGNGTVQFGSPNGELGMSITPTLSNRADLRFDGSILKLVAGTGVVPPSAANGLAITTAGNVGIGTNTPTAGYRLEVNGATLLRPGNGSLQFGSRNAELALSITPTAGNRADLRFDGSILKLAAGTGVVPPSAANGLAITTAGNVGIGTTAPIAKLHAETALANTTAVYGNAMGANGVGVYARSASGPAVYAEGNAVQLRDKGGFVKAMAYIDPFLPAAQYVVRCYNSQQAGTATSTAPCGITVTRSSAGFYLIDFGFNVEDRFVSLTAQADLDYGRGVMVGMIRTVSGSAVSVMFTRSRDDLGTSYDSRFHIMVY